MYSFIEELTVAPTKRDNLDQSQYISIKVTIAEMVFPLKVTPQEEETTRRAAKWINDKITQYRDRFQVDDRKMLLAMCALQLATELFEQENSQHLQDQQVTDGVARLYQLLVDGQQETDTSSANVDPHPTS